MVTRRQTVRLVPLFPVLAGLGLCAPARGGERKIAVELSSREVKKYGKLEVLVRTEPVFGNPYDPGEVELRVEMTAPSGKRLVIPAFYFQPFERRRLDRAGKPVEWLYPEGSPVWKARLAPTEVGRHSCAAALRDRAGTAHSAAVAFRCLPSESKGYVRVSRGDPRYFEFSEGRPFFPVGQNVAFIRDSYWAEDVFERMGESGANYARVWACCEDWAMAIEARKSAWGRSWQWEPPIVHLPGRDGYHCDERCVRVAGERGASVAVSPTRALGLRPETRYVLSGSARADEGGGLRVEIQGTPVSEPEALGRKWRRFEREFTTSKGQHWLPRISFALAAEGSAWLRDLSLREEGSGPELLREADVNRPPRGHYNQPDCFMLDKVVEAAERNGIYLQLCLLTRDHYMRSLGEPGGRDYDSAVADARNLLRYAVARWGYSAHVAVWEHFNEMDPRLPTERFYRECGEYLEEIDPYRRPRTTSNWHSSPEDWHHPEIDVGDVHFYLRPVLGGKFRDGVATVLERLTELRDQCPGKPALLSEFGMTADNWRRTEYLDKDKDFVHLHNALWASALSGVSGAAMHWFWDDIHKRDLYHLYRPVAAFVADIPWTAGKLRRAEVSVSDVRLRVVGLRGDDGAYLWVHDRQSNWWRLSVEGEEPQPIGGAWLEIRGDIGRLQRIEWWDTRAGRVLKTERARARGALRLRPPTFSRDVACKVRWR